MGNPSTLRPKPFTSEHQPKRKGRLKGAKNRSTILKKWLGVKIVIKNPTTDEEEKGTVEDEVILSLIRAAKKENVKAIQEILDSLYGKIPSKTELTGEDGKDLIPQRFQVEVVNDRGSTNNENQDE